MASPEGLGEERVQGKTEKGNSWPLATPGLWMHSHPTLCTACKVHSFPSLAGKDDPSQDQGQRGRAGLYVGCWLHPTGSAALPSLSSPLWLLIQGHSLMHAIGTHPSKHFDQKESFLSRGDVSTKADRGLGPFRGPSCTYWQKHRSPSQPSQMHITQGQLVPTKFQRGPSTSLL